MRGRKNEYEYEYEDEDEDDIAMQLDHEKLDVYQAGLRFVAWATFRSSRVPS